MFGAPGSAGVPTDVHLTSQRGALIFCRPVFRRYERNAQTSLSHRRHSLFNIRCPREGTSRRRAGSVQVRCEEVRGCGGRRSPACHQYPCPCIPGEENVFPTLRTQKARVRHKREAR